jgi:hypothetical protein
MIPRQLPRVLCSNSRTRHAGPPQSSSQVFFFLLPVPVHSPMENPKGPKPSYSKSLKIVPNGNDSPHPAGITGQSRGAAWANGSVVKRWRRKDDVPIPKKRVRLHLLRPRWRQACDSPPGIAILSFGRSRKETRYSTTASRAQHYLTKLNYNSSQLEFTKKSPPHVLLAHYVVIRRPVTKTLATNVQEIR